MSFLIKLYKRKEINQISRFFDVANNLNIDEVCGEYRKLRDEEAPERLNPYFIDTHTGVPSSGRASNRREEHLAMAIFNASHDGKLFTLPNGRNIKFIDYQTPLKAKRSDKGIGKVDIFGVIDENLPSVIELKIEGQGRRSGDTPLRALLEGLAYCAIIEKNISKIRKEALSKFDLDLLAIAPVLIIMAPEEYWKRFLQKRSAGAWLPVLNNIIELLSSELYLDIHMVSIKGSEFEMGLDEKSPVLHGDCVFVSIEAITGT